MKSENFKSVDVDKQANGFQRENQMVYPFTGIITDKVKERKGNEVPGE